LLSPGNARFGGDFLHGGKNIFVMGAGSWRAVGAMLLSAGFSDLNLRGKAMAEPLSQEVTRLLIAWRRGEPAALD
jgi:hypothetical protein